MAIRLNTSADRLLRTATLPNYNSVYTWMAWVYLVSDQDDWGIIFSLNTDSGWGDYDLFGVTSDGTSIVTEVNIAGGYTDVDSGQDMTVGAWRHLCVVRSSVTSLQMYVDGIAAGSANAHNVTGRTAVTRMETGGGWTTADYYLADIRIDRIKIWDAALTTAEVASEMYRIEPVRWANLHLWSPCNPGATERLSDWSGNAKTWTAGGTLTDEDPAPGIGWGLGLGWFTDIAAGGTVYTQAVAGATTPAGVLTKQGNKILAGASTPVGITQRTTLKSPAGASIPAGALNKLASKSPAGASIPSGLLARLTNKIVSGMTTPSGASSRQTQKELSGASLPGGSLVKEVGKILSGASTPVGILATLKTVILALFGATTPTGTLTLDAAKGVQGNSTPAGDLTKEVHKNLDGASIPVGILATLKTVVLSLFGATTPVGILTRNVNKNLDGVTAPAGSLVKRVGKWLTGITTPIGSLIGTLIAAITGTSRVYLTLDVRQSLYTLETRSINLTFGLREALSLDMLSKLLTLDSRSINLALGLRGALSLDKRAGSLSLATRSTNLTMAGR